MPVRVYVPTPNSEEPEIQLTPGQDPREGKDGTEQRRIGGAHVENLRIRFNEGSGNFFDPAPDPALNRIPFEPREGMLWRPPGVLFDELNRLPADSILIISERESAKHIQFYVRNKKIYGAITFIAQGYDWKKFQYDMDIDGIVNDTGSPALYQRDLNAKDAGVMQQYPEMPPLIVPGDVIKP
jgi:hypothetical protein